MLKPESFAAHSPPHNSCVSAPLKPAQRLKRHMIWTSMSKSKMISTKTQMKCVILLVLIGVAVQLETVEALAEADCPVCFKIANKLRDEVEDKTVDNVSRAFLGLCEQAKKDSVESKFCYYLGGQEVSATRTYKEMAEKMSYGLPTDKICEHLRSRDSQICEIREKKPIDLKTVDLKKLKVADLKRILKERGEVCESCFEKSEFIKKVEEIKAREEL